MAEIEKLPLRFVSPKLSRRAYITGGKPTLSCRSIDSRPITALAELLSDAAKNRQLLKNHHDGYIDWAEFERNQKLLAANAYGKAGDVKSGCGGRALLAGLLGCAR